MATPAYVAVKVLHVLSAALALGYVALTPIWHRAAVRTRDGSLVRHTLELIRTLQARLAYPTLAVLVVTGLLLVAGPLADPLYSLTRSRWAQGATLVGLVFAFVVAVGLSGPVRKMLPLAQNGEREGPAMDKLWGDWRTALYAAVLLGVVSTVLMVNRPGV